MKQSAVLSLSRILTGTWSLSKLRHHNVPRLTQSLSATFLDKAGMCFSDLQNMVFLISHHCISSACLPRGKCCVLGLSLWAGISVAVDPIFCSYNEKAKTLRVY